MEALAPTVDERERYWDAAYREHGADGVSWHQEDAGVSLELIEALELPRHGAVVDVGGGASVLAGQLVERGFTDVSVLDLSAEALAAARRRAGPRSPIHWLHEDLLTWCPARHFDLWHDRAVLHFLVDRVDRDRYRERLRDTLVRGGAVVVGAFALDGPERCSGLPVARYSPEQLATLLGSEFELLETRREEHVTPAGVVQPFTWIAGRLHKG